MRFLWEFYWSEIKRLSMQGHWIWSSYSDMIGHWIDISLQRAGYWSLRFLLWWLLVLSLLSLSNLILEMEGNLFPVIEPQPLHSFIYSFRHLLNFSFSKSASIIVSIEKTLYHEMFCILCAFNNTGNIILIFIERWD